MHQQMQAIKNFIFLLSFTNVTRWLFHLFSGWVYRVSVTGERMLKTCGV